MASFEAATRRLRGAAVPVRLATRGFREPFLVPRGGAGPDRFGEADYWLVVFCDDEPVLLPDSLVPLLGATSVTMVTESGVTTIATG